MSLVLPWKCPIVGCRYYHKIVYADRTQGRNHILYDHDYTEKLDASLRLGIIKDLSERRSPDYLSERLAEAGIWRAKHEVAMH